MVPEKFTNLLNAVKHASDVEELVDSIIHSPEARMCPDPDTI
jgi:hypothetical protein